MDLYKISALILIYWLPKSFVGCYPSFGNEYVHIKLHVPKEAASNVHNNLHKLEQAAHPPVPLVTEHKVIHHYHHRRRRPYQKGSSHGKGASHSSHSDGILDTLIVSEVKKPSSLDASHLDYLNHAQEIAQHISALPEPVKKPKKHVDTYTIIEETKKIPPMPIVETYKVIESKVPVQRPQHHVETYKIIESKAKQKLPSIYPGHPAGRDYHENNRPHIDTVRIVEHAHDEHSSSDYAAKRPNYERPVKFVSHHQHYEARPESITSNYDSYHVAHNYHTEAHAEGRPEGGYHYDKPAIEFHIDYAHQHDTYKAPIESAYVESDNSYSPLDDLVPPSHGQSSYYSSYQNDALDGIGQIRVESEGYNYPAPSFNHHTGNEPGGYSYPAPDSYSVAETYNGVDSYSAPHVQGVDNGAYLYPPK